jgi:hypothetical protein
LVSVTIRRLPDEDAIPPGDGPSEVGRTKLRPPITSHQSLFNSH